EQGVLSVEDADAAVSYGPRPRGGGRGPGLQWHPGGGQGGIKHFIDHLLPARVEMWERRGTPPRAPGLPGTPRGGGVRGGARRTVEQLAQAENETIVELFRVREQQELRPQHA